jgi:hypothetical protein
VLQGGSFLTYGSLTAALGYDASTHSRHIGQVCSLIDSACYWAKLPMLSLEKFRSDDGAHNPESFGGAFTGIKDTLIRNAAARAWSVDDVARIKRALDHMNGESAQLQWQRIGGFGQPALDRIGSYR